MSGEQDLNQCTNHSPAFVWRISGLSDEDTSYSLELSLRSLPLSDSAFVRNWRFPAEISSFHLIDYGFLEDGKEYLLNLRVVFSGNVSITGRNLKFRMNSPPTQVKILTADDIIVRDSLFFITHTRSMDVQTESLIYQYQVSSDSQFQEIIVDTSIQNLRQDTITTYINLSGFPDTKIYFYRVRSFDGVEYSSWSKEQKFRLNRIPDAPLPFALLDPAHNSYTPWEPTLRWQRPVDPDSAFGGGISSYTLEISGDSTFSGEVIRFDSLPGEEFQISGLEKHARYYWRVTAHDADGNHAISRRFYSFVTNEGNSAPAIPKIIFPERLVIISPYDSICWVKASDPEPLDSVRYIIQFLNQILLVDSISEKSNLFIPGDSVICYPMSRFSTDSLKEGHLYRFRVEAADNWGGRSGFSEDYRFFWDDGINYPPEPPGNLLFPVDTIVSVQIPEFSWKHAFDPDSFDTADSLQYELQLLCKGVDCIQRDTFSVVTDKGKNHFRPDTELKENGTYIWRVRTIDPQGAYSSWTAFAEFRVNAFPEPPESPVRIKFPHLLEEITLQDTFLWYPVTDPDPGDEISYLIQIASNYDFKSPGIEYLLGAREVPEYYVENENMIHVPMRLLFDNQSFSDDRLYYLRIIPRDCSGATPVKEASVHRIIINMENDPPEKVVRYRYPSDGSLVRKSPLIFRWDPSFDPDFSDTKNRMSYRIALWTKGREEHGFPKFYHTKPGENFLLIPDELPDNVEYEFSIQAIDDEGITSSWGDTLSFYLDLKREAPGRVEKGFLPADTAIVENSNPVISWLPASDPDPFQDETVLSYCLVYFDLADTADKKTVYSETGENSVQLSGLSEDHFYIYSVCAIDPDGISGKWSPRQIFGVNAVQSPPNPFTLYYPGFQNDSVQVNFSFQWQKTTDPDLLDEVVYFLYFGEDSILMRNGVISSFDETSGDTISYSPGIYFEPGKDYYWGVVAVDKDGNETWGSSSDIQPFRFSVSLFNDFVSNLPTDYALEQNFPNPFNTETSIRYQLPEIATVRLAIYDLLGKKICTLFSGRQAPGIYNVTWDGKDMNGVPVPGGMYIYRMETTHFSCNRKMVLLR